MPKVAKLQFANWALLPPPFHDNDAQPGPHPPPLATHTCFRVHGAPAWWWGPAEPSSTLTSGSMGQPVGLTAAAMSCV